MSRPSTAAHADDLVVFHIGMTVRAWHRPDLWGPVAMAMPAMIAELARNRAAAARGEAPDLGCLGAQTLIGRSGPWVVQYWKSPEHLYAYAHDVRARHLPAWRRFNGAARRHPDAVGIWHETYAVPAEGIETFYGNGACVGLARFTGVESRDRPTRARRVARQ